MGPPKFMKEQLGTGIGTALVILAVFIGFGGCCYLVNMSEAKLNESRKGSVSITNSFNTIK